MTVWEDVDERVLAWVFSLGPSLNADLYDFQLREPEPFQPIAGLSSRQVHEALSRLLSHGLIDGRESPTFGSSIWYRLRVTAAGLIVLGEWPDLDRVASAAAIHRLLSTLAEQAPAEERSALRRAAGAVSRTADEVVTGTVRDLARSAGRDVVDT